MSRKPISVSLLHKMIELNSIDNAFVLLEQKNEAYIVDESGNKQPYVGWLDISICDEIVEYGNDIQM